MKLKNKDKLNAVVYKVPNMDIILNSLNMNMTVKDYCNKAPKETSYLLKEEWTFIKRYKNFSSYKCKNGSILLID